MILLVVLALLIVCVGGFGLCVGGVCLFGLCWFCGHFDYRLLVLWCLCICYGCLFGLVLLLTFDWIGGCLIVGGLGLVVVVCGVDMILCGCCMF